MSYQELEWFKSNGYKVIEDAGENGYIVNDGSYEIKKLQTSNSNTIWIITKKNKQLPLGMSFDFGEVKGLLRKAKLENFKKLRS